MDSFHQPFAAAGHEIDVLDLHREDFDPRFSAADHDHFWGGPVPEDVDAMHRRVEAADHLAFIFPVYWWGMPALMKGWVERVFTQGWAYQYGAGVEDRGRAPVSSMLRNTPTVLIGVGGAKVRSYEKYGYDEAMRTLIDVGTFAYCGIDDVESHLILNVEGEHNEPARRAGLVAAAKIGASFADPARKKRRAREDFLANRAARP